MRTKFFIDFSSSPALREKLEVAIRESGELDCAYPRYLYVGSGISLEFDPRARRYFYGREGIYTEVPPLLECSGLRVRRISHEPDSSGSLGGIELFYPVTDIWE